MGRPETELRRIISNMETMGWQVRRVTSGSGSFIVVPPGGSAVTINARATGHGTGLDNIMREVRKTGYQEAWQRHLDALKDRRVVAAVAAQVHHSSVETQRAPEPTPTPTTVFGAPVSPTPSQNINGTRIDRDTIDGVAVVGREPAKLATPATDGKAVALSGVDEILLADERILYQCARSMFCADAFPSPESARAHLKKHGTATRAAAADKLTAIRSKAGRAAQDARRERVSLLVGDESRAQWLNDLAAALEEAAPMLRELARIKAAPSVDEDELEALRRKAANWDKYRDFQRMISE